MACRVVGQLSGVFDRIRDVWLRFYTKVEVMNRSQPTGFVCQERSVWFGCIRDVSGIPITNPGTSCLTGRFPTTSSVLGDALGMVDVTTEDYEAKCQLLFLPERLSLGTDRDLQVRRPVISSLRLRP